MGEAVALELGAATETGKTAMKAQTILAVVLALFSGVSLRASEKPYEVESWPYEGMPYFRVLSGELHLRLEPSDHAQISNQLTINKGSVITFESGVEELLREFSEYGKVYGVDNVNLINQEVILDKSIQRAVAPGVLRAKRDGSFDGYAEGSSNEQEFHFKKGDLIEELVYLGEGYCRYRFQRQVIDTHCLLYNVANRDVLEEISDRKTEWWLRVARNGATLGWLKMNDSNGPLELIETIK